MDGMGWSSYVGQWSSKRAPAVRIHFIRKDLMAYENKYLWQILQKEPTLSKRLIKLRQCSLRNDNVFRF